MIGAKRAKKFSEIEEFENVMPKKKRGRPSKNLDIQESRESSTVGENSIIQNLATLKED